MEPAALLEETRRVAAANDGLITRADFIRMSLTEPEIRKLSRGLVRLRRGTYMIDEPASREARHLLTARAVLEVQTSGQYLSHTTAAAAWGLPLFDVELTLVHMSRDTGQPSHKGRDFWHQRHPVPLSDRSQVDGVPVTTVSRVLVDCATLQSTATAVIMADAALNRGLTSRDEIERKVGAMGRRRGHDAALRMLALADPKCESPGETRLRLVLIELGFEVHSQYVVTSGGRFLGRSDFLLADSRVLVEFDGRAKYGDAPERSHWEEKLRHDRIVEAGYEIVRVVWGQLDDAARIKERLLRALARSRRA